MTGKKPVITWEAALKGCFLVIMGMICHGDSKNMHKWKQEHIYFVFIILIIFCIFQYGIRKTCGFSVYPDEFGYWASAAGAAGYDWTQVASLGSYYSFGYSLLLTPLLKLFHGGIAAYRAAIVVNMALMCAGAWIIYLSGLKLFPQLDRTRRIFASGIAALYPAWIVYMQMTLAEALLMFLYTAVVCCFISLVQKPRWFMAALLILLLVYSYTVHMRTVGIAIACAMVLFVWGMTNPAMRRQILIMFGAAAIAGLVVVFIKRNVVLSVFSQADAETLAANDYASQISKIKDILTFSGMKHFIREVTGKIFYLGMATYGIFYWAMGWCVKEGVSLLKKIIRKQTDQCTVSNWTALFLLLSVIGEVLICSIFMHNSTLIDCLVYGRYNEFIVPVLLLVGIAVMLKSRWVLIISLISGALSGMMLLPIFSAIDKGNMRRIRGYFITGISSPLKEENGDPYSFFLKAWLIGFVCMILIAGMILVVKKYNHLSWLLGMIMVLEVLLGVQASEKYVYHPNRFGFQDMIIAEKILESEDQDIRVTYLEEGITPYIDFQQMQLRDIPIHVIRQEELTDTEEWGDFLIVSSQTNRQEELEQKFKRHINANLHILYYEPIMQESAENFEITELNQIMSIGEACEARAFPDENASVLFGYETGASVWVTGETRDGWYRTSYQGQEGYLLKKNVVDLQIETENMGVVDVADSGLDEELAQTEVEGKIFVEEVERQRGERKRSRIWTTVILLLIAGIFTTGLLSIAQKNKSGKPETDQEENEEKPYAEAKPVMAAEVNIDEFDITDLNENDDFDIDVEQNEEYGYETDDSNPLL